MTGPPYRLVDTLFSVACPRRQKLNGRPVNFLFVGMIYPRRGVASLVQAFEHIPAQEATLTLVGRLRIPTKTSARFAQRVNRVPPVSRQALVKHFVEADCVVFPSLFEGSAIMSYEPPAAGLGIIEIGIIQSKHGGDGIRNDGRNGEILDDISVNRLESALGSVIDNPDRLAAWQEACREMRAERTWRPCREHVRNPAET